MDALLILNDELDRVCAEIARAACIARPAIGNPEPARHMMLDRPHGTDECDLVRLARRAERTYAAVCALRDVYDRLPAPEGGDDD